MAPTQPESVKGTILLVEDDADTERLVIRALRRVGVDRVRVARDGEEALKVLGETGAPPGLVLLDAKLPKVDGYEVLRRMGTGAPSRPTVVMFTSEDATVAENRARQLGASEFVYKPIDYNDLMDAVAHIVDRWMPKAA